MTSKDYRVRPSFAKRGEGRVPEVDDAADDAEPASFDEPVEPREAHIADAMHGLRLDKVVVALAPEFSRTHLQGLIEGGHVRLDDGVVTTSSRKVLAGQRLCVELVPTAESRAFRPEVMTIPVVFEDGHLMVVDKPAGMVVHPAAGNWQGTLLNGLLARNAAAASLPRAGIVHRLDKDTSGLMVVGKTLQAVTALSRAIAAREVHREYLALAHGAWPAGVTHIDAAIARDAKSRIRMAVQASGKASQTDVERVALAHPNDAGAHGGVSALRCTLFTGRTHQIRVHMASRGHPLLADALYGGRPALGMQRQALLAARLAFAHPTTGRALSFEARAPQDFERAWAIVVGHDMR
jgi:23S rRNA pseudouridine1911/1915/1917 synthase